MTDVTSSPEPDRVTTQSSAEVELHDDLTVSPHSEAQGSSVSTLALKQHAIGDSEAVSDRQSQCIPGLNDCV